MHHAIEDAFCTMLLPDQHSYHVPSPPSLAALGDPNYPIMITTTLGLQCVGDISINGNTTEHAFMSMNKTALADPSVSSCTVETHPDFPYSKTQIRTTNHCLLLASS